MVFNSGNNKETISNYFPKIPESFLNFVDLLCRHIYSLHRNSQNIIFKIHVLKIWPYCRYCDSGSWYKILPLIHMDWRDDNNILNIYVIKIFGICITKNVPNQLLSKTEAIKKSAEFCIFSSKLDFSPLQKKLVSCLLWLFSMVAICHSNALNFNHTEYWLKNFYSG